MKKNLTWKVVVIVAVLLVFAFGIIGNPAEVKWDKEGLKTALMNRIHLGLDLRGGTHLILQVVVNDAVNAETDRAIERIKEDLANNKVTYSDITKPDAANAPERIAIKGITPDGATTLRRVSDERLPEYSFGSGPEGSYTLTMKPAQLKDLKDRAVQQAIQKIRERVDSLGVSEPVIQEHGLGDYQILVQLPGVDDPARVKEVMQSTAMLEIRQVFGGPYSKESEAAQGQMQQPDTVVLPGKSESDPGTQVFYLVARSSAVAGHDLRQARVGRDQNGGANVQFNLTRDGGVRFSQFTSAHVGDKLGVILDGKVMEVANIKSEISDSGEIEGRFTDQQASDLALILNSGALPASIKYLEERTVGPSLGMDSIRQGVRAAIIGFVAVIIFMLIYYKGAGINADLSLLLNLVILLGFMGYFGAVLTLPGIAGVILTVGMGVDSNVLIFERIREELRNGKTPPSAVEQGFGHAWLTIIDTHVTTIVSAIILFLFGTGPVKGFAVTLSFGLFANLFTAVFVSRVIFDSILNRHQRGEALSI
ncbi:protein-export membrane protein SecD [Candidatus Koribacter versatilis Ellin345]|uniref:Protein translocase subunit SecD n=1 Tax=Koribacter versatilis (strain Ellin345) TaxID=204669 RepID=SECD_KORVE|nr:protein translocase subunit SecD [Candidatus Koribacter versatilis]Q1IVE9.1 RecName: Full=Protein translocase subunit SecD [Candidatus Koribacter versatilis Ellin345]ABF39151.1 protein-export membrane protein SecD [Candidatus Koribacter versatilis Ellin345]